MRDFSRPLIATLVVLVLNTEIGSSETISAFTAEGDPTLGSAFQSEKETFVGQSCLEGTSKPTGAAVSSFNFEQQLSQQQAAEQLGLQAGGKARFGAVSASASARFMQNSVSNKYSVSAVWLSHYKMPTDKFEYSGLSDIGSGVRNNDDRWSQTCGDQYVNEITRGAKLLFTIRVDFSSEAQKRDFEAKFSLSGPLYSASANLKTASDKFSRDSKVVVSAVQVGGDVSKLTQIFRDSGGTSDYVQCTLGDFTKCASVIAGALQYATDTKSGFPSQLAPGANPGPAPLEYRTRKYETVAIYPKNYPDLNDVIREHRKELHSKFETQFAYLVLANRLLEFGMAGGQQRNIVKEKEVVESNISLILASSKICYETPPDCPTSVQALSLQGIDSNVFALPDLPLASFRIFTSPLGIWSRADSIEFMENVNPVPGETYFIDQDHMSISYFSNINRKGKLLALGKDVGASVGLLVEGVALREATIFFENEPLKKLQIEYTQEDRSGKLGERQAFIVVETIKQNPGWLDVDLAELRGMLWQEKMPHAEGRFYILIEDLFGRQTSFDVEHQSWRRSIEQVGDRVRTIEQVKFRNRWWDEASGGTSLGGDAQWSEQGDERRELTGPAK